MFCLQVYVSFAPLSLANLAFCRLGVDKSDACTQKLVYLGGCLCIVQFKAFSIKTEKQPPPNYYMPYVQCVNCVAVVAVLVRKCALHFNGASVTADIAYRQSWIIVLKLIVAKQLKSLDLPPKKHVFQESTQIKCFSRKVHVTVNLNI